ncbi:MAG: hypothetical protein AB7N76_30560 [Planctomycetota bacterium]
MAPSDHFRSTLLALALGLGLAPAALAGDPEPKAPEQKAPEQKTPEKTEAPKLGGVELAKAIEAAKSDEARAKLIGQVTKLSAQEGDALVRWATQQREQGQGWKYLAPALGAVASRAAILEIVAPLRAAQEHVDSSYVDEACLGLRRCAPRLVFQALLGGLSERDIKVWMKHREVLIRLLSIGSRDRIRDLNEALEEFLRAAGEDLGRRERDRILERVEAVTGGLSVSLGEEPLDELLRALDSQTIDTTLMLGLARGLRRRVTDLYEERIAARVQELGLANEGELGPDDIAGIKANLPQFAGRIWIFATHPESSVRTEAFRIAPCVRIGLDADWADVLIGALAMNRPRDERDAAWGALKQLTGQKLRQNQPTWQQWWKTKGATQ